MSPSKLNDREILTAAYRDFNARRIENVLARMHPDVEWANGMEGGHVSGREAVRAYWTRQWSILDPHVEPMSIEGVGRMAVMADPQGAVSAIFKETPRQ